jgi:hypothetical protein
MGPNSELRFSALYRLSTRRRFPHDRQELGPATNHEPDCQRINGVRVPLYLDAVGRNVMAQDEHLKLINEAIQKQDIAIWNRWRQGNPDIRPDLSGIDLRRANLKKAAFRGVILKDANLRGTDLSSADLSGADLNRTNLVRTNFSAANLTDANFNGANLSEANLSEANLNQANFTEALLLGALLIGADLCRASLEDNVKSLMPSQIRTAKNWETAYYSKGTLEDLGLPLDHNEELRKGTEEKQSQ